MGARKPPAKQIGPVFLQPRCNFTQQLLHFADTDVGGQIVNILAHIMRQMLLSSKRIQYRHVVT